MSQLLRQLAGAPLRGENDFRAGIEVGQVGTEQAKAARDSTEARGLTEMPAVYEFRFSEDFLIEIWRRYRRHKRHRAFGVIRLVAVVIAGLFGVFFITLRLWWLAVFFALLIVGAYQGHRIDEWLARRRFRKSPYHDDPVRIEISDDGFWIRGSKSETSLSWAAFTRTVRFPDGWLCLQGPGVANWLPDSALRPDESTEHLDELVRRRDGQLEVTTRRR